MWVFWTKGYFATSIDDLVKATGVARSGIYSEFGGKEEAFTNCLAHYRAVIANPAIAILHRNEDGMDAISEYFDHFIEMHRKHGMPGPGCFFANTVTEVAPHSEAVSQLTSVHLTELKFGFREALRRAARKMDSQLGHADLDNLANFLAIASQGLWSYARLMHDLADIQNMAREYLALVRSKLKGGSN